MKLSYDGDLMTAAITVTFRGKSTLIGNMIIDTGSSHTIISPDVLEAVGVTYENGDAIYEAYGIGGTAPFFMKTMDKIDIGLYIIKNVRVDIGLLPENHPGLIGLDILKKHQFIIDFQQAELYQTH
ncbi:aspartyl protease family protein [Alteribacillus sp. HJP-4]|uniref:aspartyl protease family protein n=1 Tax=Alteribacillus sp. HJP-4 TaxID=2775394 RepID=UPI0035CD20B5